MKAGGKSMGKARAVPRPSPSTIRFCYYDHRGRFQRSPLMIRVDDVAALRGALRRTPKLRALLRRALG